MCVYMRDYIAQRYLVMLHRGSMRWTVGSSMYSKARLSGTLARSTLKLTCTGPALVTDGAEKHTISDMVLLVGAPKGGDLFMPVTVTLPTRCCDGKSLTSRSYEPCTLL